MHELIATTLMTPETKVPKLTVIELVPCPPRMVSPDGTVHTYDVAFGTAGTVYAIAFALHNPNVLPVMRPIGDEMEFAIVVTALAEVVHPLLSVAVTEYVPAVETRIE